MSLVTSYSTTEKLQLLSDFQDSDYSLVVYSDYHNVRSANMRKWIHQFLLAGLAGIMRPNHNQRYSRKLKIAACEDYLSKKLSNKEILAKYQIRNISQLHQWLIRYNSDKFKVINRTGKRVRKMGRKVSFDEKKQIVQWLLDHDNNYQAAGVSRQVYYKWLNHSTSLKECQDEEILAVIKSLETEHKYSVGYDKMTRLINRDSRISYRVNRKRVIRIMSAHGIKADYRQLRRKRVQEHQTYQAENILNRQFRQTAANQVWVTDTTELVYGIQQSKVRLHVVLDLYGQYPISWLITPTETAQGAIQVFELVKLNEGALAKLIHTDRGAAYTSKDFNQYLVVNDSRHSYSAPGTPADNAVIEHWWADFKAIWIAHTPKAQSLNELEHQVSEGIDYFTNKFISEKRNDLTATEYRFGKAN